MQNEELSPPPKATLMRHQCDIKATSMRVASQAVATSMRPPSHPKATLKPPRSHLEATWERMQKEERRMQNGWAEDRLQSVFGKYRAL